MKNGMAVLAAVAAVLLAVTSARAGQPTPAATPLGENDVRVRVVNDLNGDGASQASEPGMANVDISVGCGDAFLRYVTDSDGYATISLFEGCVRVARPFGWLPTTPAFARLAPGPGVRIFLLHDLGATVMEMRGDIIIDGLPPRRRRALLEGGAAVCGRCRRLRGAGG